MLIFILRQTVEFLRILYGLINKPYVTYRKLALNHKIFQFGYIALLISIYLMLSTLAREGLLSNPLFLTKSAIKAGIYISITFFVMTGIIFYVGKLFNGEGQILTITKLWAFSLIPTLVWFLIATVFYVLVPPPRTVSLQGQIFSAAFLGFSIGCFFWKGILYYLTLRIGHHLKATRIVFASSLILPLSIAYSILLYRLNIFRVPFI